MHNGDMPAGTIKALFLDIGGVLLSNGWGHEQRAAAVARFSLDEKEFEGRHAIAFEVYERGEMTLAEYLDLVVFYQQRSFSATEFEAFMFTQSVELSGAISFFTQLRRQHGLKVVAVSNEGRELNAYRIKQFGLDELFDMYISSCYVGLHKPDQAILQMACDVSQIAPEEALYVDDREILVEVARSFGLNAYHYTGLERAREYMDQCPFRTTSKK